MRAIQNTMRRFLIVLNLHAIKDALLRVCRKRTPAVIQPSEPVVETPPQDDEMYAEDDDVDERFAAWEEARSETLQQANDCERQALRLLSRAALLRAAVQCDDHGETFLAGELRAHANDVAVSQSALNHTALRLVGFDDTPAECGA
jgi:hypothetical protein